MNSFELQVWVKPIVSIESNNFNIKALKPLGVSLYEDGVVKAPKTTFSHTEISAANMWWRSLPKILDISRPVFKGYDFSFIVEITPSKSSHGTVSIKAKIVHPDIITHGNSTTNINPLIASRMFRILGIHSDSDTDSFDGFPKDTIEFLTMMITASNNRVGATMGISTKLDGSTSGIDYRTLFLNTPDKSISIVDLFKGISSGSIPVDKKNKYVINTLVAYDTLGGDEHFEKFVEIVRSYEMAITTSHIDKLMDSDEATESTPFKEAFSMVTKAVASHMAGDGILYVIKHPWLSFTQDLKTANRYTAPFNIDVLRMAFRAMKEKGADGDSMLLGIDNILPLHAIVSSLLDESNASYIPLDALAHQLNKDEDVVMDEVKKDRLLYATVSRGRQMITMYSIYKDEESLAHELASRFNDDKDVSYDDADEIFEKTKSWIPEASKLNQEQVKSVKNSVLKKFSVITGGPGTGKTTLLRVLVANAMMSGVRKIAVLAPSSRAANNLLKKLPSSEFRGVSVSTVHSYLGAMPISNHDTFKKSNPGYNHSYGMVIVDEASMVSHQFLKMIVQSSPKADIVLCGDVDQIGSIGRGNPFSDIISNEDITGNNVTVLSKNYRQESGSDIPVKAKSILDGNLTTTPIKLEDFIKGYSVTRSGDFANIEVPTFENGEILHKTVRDVVLAIANGLVLDKKGVPIDIREVQVISPDKSEERVGELAATEVINNDDDIKDTFNKHRSGEKFQVAVHDRVENFYVGDRVIVNRNSGPNGLINGQMGIVLKTYIGSEDNKMTGMTVHFEGSGDIDISEGAAAAGKISHAIAISAHKSQGSEYGCAIVVIGKDSMGSRNLLYTAVTRAQKLCILISSVGAADKMSNTDEDLGNSNMRHQLDSSYKSQRGINLS